MRLREPEPPRRLRLGVVAEVEEKDDPALTLVEMPGGARDRGPVEQLLVKRHVGHSGLLVEFDDRDLSRGDEARHADDRRAVAQEVAYLPIDAAAEIGPELIACRIAAIMNVRMTTPTCRNSATLYTWTPTTASPGSDEGETNETAPEIV